jgi:hypothetical protein
VRALRELMRGIGAVKERIDEERGGLGDVPGVFVLIGGKKSAAGVGAGQQGSKDPDAELGLGVEDGDLGGGDMVPFSLGLLSGIPRGVLRLRRGINMGVSLPKHAFLY